MRGYGLDGSNPVFHYRGMLAKNGLKMHSPRSTGKQNRPGITFRFKCFRVVANNILNN
jgi:hypothetical protein